MASSSAAVPTTLDVPYDKPELKGLKKASLVSLVARQAEKWPGPDVYTARSTSVPRLRTVLLDPRYGFTKSVAISSAESGSVSALTPSDEEVTPPPNPDDEIEGPLVPNDNIPKPIPARWVKLLIEDTRKSSSSGRYSKISQEVLLGIVEDTGEEWKAELNDILCELQNSNSAIMGPVKLSYRDPEAPDYWIAFVKVTDDALLEEAQTFPRLVSIPSTNQLEILVEQAEDIYFHAPPPLAGSSNGPLDARELFDVNDPAAKPLEHARRRTRKAQTSADLDADWLKEQLKNTTGYEDFKHNQHRVQTNPGVVASWKFVSDFSDKYFGTQSRVQGRKKIQKKSIQNALQVGSTAYSEAIKATAILGRYGEGGKTPAQSVIAHVNLREDPPKGAKELYPFLVDWDKEHTTK
ncbi:hypothetical protein B0H11DRAFT_2417651 [Mycena galericulata]|nr:hypothetical protein B0H11DRAFT_2417651 [Mycena galericulata]